MGRRGVEAHIRILDQVDGRQMPERKENERQMPEMRQREEGRWPEREISWD